MEICGTLSNILATKKTTENIMYTEGMITDGVTPTLLGATEATSVL